MLVTINSSTMSVEIKPLGIVSVRDLAYRLGVEIKLLESVADTAGSYHAPFESTNSPRPFQRKPFIEKSRNIDNPTDILKKVQGLINVKLLRQLGLPNRVFGGRKGHSVIQNAKKHLGSKVLVTIDVKQFFPSISNVEIYSVWAHMLGCSPKVAGLLTRLTTFERRLPQGAPTSTALANLVLLSCDSAIRGFCGANGITYTSWVDDLALLEWSLASLLMLYDSADCESHGKK
jgi:RNA-directed DNA polymerase